MTIIKNIINSKKQVIVVGSGAAGMMTALTCSKFTSVTLITDGKLGSSNSLMAQGGIQVPKDSDIDRSAMVDDMMKSARGLASREKIVNFVGNINEVMDYLLDLGVNFDSEKDGTLIRRHAGGLSTPRIISSKDRIGLVVMNALIEKVKSSKNIEILQKCRVEDIKVFKREGICLFKVSVVEMRKKESKNSINKKESLIVSTLVCATGGKTYGYAKRVGKRTTNPFNSNHKIVELLEKIGFKERNKDLYQYQPFGIVIPSKMRGKNIPETITNFSVEIVDRDGLKVCNTQQDRLEIVKSMNKAFEEGRAFELGGGEWGFKLIVPNKKREQIIDVIPKLKSLMENNFEEVYIQPVLHYYLGGFEVDENGESNIEGLFLAGEITTGLHGANRLMGTGLMESLVGGMIVGKNAAQRVNVLK